MALNYVHKTKFLNFFIPDITVFVEDQPTHFGSNRFKFGLVRWDRGVVFCVRIKNILTENGKITVKM